MPESQRRGSYISTTDTESASFRTPLETPGQLSQFPSELDLTEKAAAKDLSDNVSEKSATGTIIPTAGEDPGSNSKNAERPVTAVDVTRDATLRQNAEIPSVVGEHQAATLNREVPSSNDEKHGVKKDKNHNTSIISEPQATIAQSGPTQENHEASKVATPETDSSRVSEKEKLSESEKDVHEVLVAPGDPTGATTGEAAAAEAKAEQEEVEEDETIYPTGLKLTLITLGLLLATFVVALDNTIIATAIPQITTVFNSINDVGWYGSSYLLCTTSLQPTFGKIYAFFNIKYTYLTALAIFELGSIICAVATNSVMLIVGRAIAGAGAAGLFSGGMTIIAFSVPLRKRAIYVALLSSTFGVASVVGPLIGGVFTDAPNLTWRWCFWINLPVGGIAMLTVFLFFKNPERKHSNLTFVQKLEEMDLLGAFVLIGCVVCLLLALQWGGTQYPWSDSKVWGCFLGFGLLLLLFIGIQIWRGEKATIPLRIMKQRTVAAGCVFSALLAMGLYTTIYYLPFYFQSVQGTSAKDSGIRTIPYLVSNTLAAIAIGAVITWTGHYVPFLWIGSAIFAAGCGILYLLKVGDGPARWIGYQLLAGIGAGMCVQIPFISVQVVLNAKDMPIGNAITIFFNTLGGALSVSIAQNIFSNKLLEGLQASLPEELAQAVLVAGATYVRAVTPPAFLDIVLQAYNTAITQAFILPIAVACLAFLASLAFEWRSIKGKKLSMGGAA